MRNLFLFTGLLSVLFSCHKSQISNKNLNQVHDFQVLYQSEYGGNASDEVSVITNSKEFEEFWTSTTFQPIEEVPKVNFDKQMIIVKNLPSQRTGGFSYSIKSVTNHSGKINVIYAVKSPEGMVTQAITNPLFVIATQKVEQPKIEFTIQN